MLAASATPRPRPTDRRPNSQLKGSNMETTNHVSEPSPVTTAPRAPVAPTPLRPLNAPWPPSTPYGPNTVGAPPSAPPSPAIRPSR